MDEEEELIETDGRGLYAPQPHLKGGTDAFVRPSPPVRQAVVTLQRRTEETLSLKLELLE
jgi:hypothetical protein